MSAPALLVEPLKVLLASAGAGLLLWSWWLRRRGRPEAYRRGRDGALVALGLLGAAAWGNFFLFRPGFVHGWDSFHYYLGGKYFPELGYTRLYACAAAAEAQDEGPARLRAREVRDLETDAIVPGRLALERAADCMDRFSAARWAAFRHDVRWFRERMEPERWARMLRDHGYNASPAWAALGGLLAATGPASWTQIALLSAVDPALLALMWVGALRSFGWRATCVALIFWGTNFPARFAWTGGAFLRQDWLVLSASAVALLRAGRPLAAGLAAGWAASLRLFPALLLAGVLLGAGGRGGRAGRGRELSALLAGALAAVLGLAVLGAAAGGGAGVWTAFARNSLKHAASPITNRMGLATLVAHDPEHSIRAQVASPPDSRPVLGWAEGRARALASRWPLFLGAAGALAATVLWAARRQPPWVAAVLGTALIPAAGELACYYYSFLLLWGLLTERREGIGAGLCALSAAGGLLGLVVPWEDELYALLSLATLLFLAGALVALGRRPLGEGGRPGA